MANLGPMLSSVLARYGLSSLGEWASQRWTEGATLEEIELELYERPEFIARFPALKERERRGLPSGSVDEYLAYENFAQSTALSFGLTLTKAEVDDNYAHNVSVKEMEGRIGLYAAARFEAPPEVVGQLKQLYNLSEGDLVRHWINPKESFARLQTQFTSARIGAMANASGYGQLAQQEAEYLASAGVDETEARQGFGDLTRMRDLFSSLDRTEQEVSRQDQLAFLALGTGVEGLERRARKRAATFEEGGQFATGRLGIAGLGSATTT